MPRSVETGRPSPRSAPRGVIVVNGVDSRLRSAEAFGADAVASMLEMPTVDARIARLHELRDGEGADVGFEVAG